MHHAPTPFRIHIPEAALLDLQQRLGRTRLPNIVAGRSWAEGTDPHYLREVLVYWTDRYDWRRREAWLNSFDHYQATVDGVGLHFIRAGAPGRGAIPLLLMQGWPSSFVQVLDFLPLLTAAGEDSPGFDVVAVSLPGYAFSELPDHPGMSFSRVADLVVKLMVEVLGYARFAARGSDQGALVQQQIGLKYPQHLIGLHRSGITPFLHPLPSDLDAEETAYQARVAQWAQQETAYARLHALRPETLLPALTDSPAGLASWILEKFQRWGDGGTNLDGHFGRDKLLDNICLHWFAGSGAGAIRLYHEAGRDPGLTDRVEVPTAIAMPLKDGITVPAPRRWAERFYNVQQWTVLEQGGHFPEWETPVALAHDIRRFFRSLM